MPIFGNVQSPISRQARPELPECAAPGTYISIGIRQGCRGESLRTGGRGRLYAARRQALIRMQGAFRAVATRYEDDLLGLGEEVFEISSITDSSL